VKPCAPVKRRRRNERHSNVKANAESSAVRTSCYKPGDRGGDGRGKRGRAEFKGAKREAQRGRDLASRGLRAHRPPARDVTRGIEAPRPSGAATPGARMRAHSATCCKYRGAQRLHRPIVGGSAYRSPFDLSLVTTRQPGDACRLIRPGIRDSRTSLALPLRVSRDLEGLIDEGRKTHRRSWRGRGSGRCCRRSSSGCRSAPSRPANSLLDGSGWLAMGGGGGGWRVKEESGDCVSRAGVCGEAAGEPSRAAARVGVR
jgi:hypothetical protein